MRRFVFLRILFVPVLAIGTASSASAAPAPRLQPVERAEEIVATGDLPAELAPFDRLMRGFLVEHDVPGAAIAVAKDGRLVLARGYGFADVETRAAVEPDALFRIASISKPLTGAVVLRLVSQGRLKLSDRIADLLALEQLAGDAGIGDPRWREITIGHLLYHSGGFDRDVSYDPMFQSRRIAKTFGIEGPPMPRDIARFLLREPLDFAPGERMEYSNFGYALLGLAIAERGGATYEDLVREHIWCVLGDSRSRIGSTRARADGEVRYHSRRAASASVFDDETVAAPYGTWCLEAMDAHGGWISSAPALVRFAVAFDHPGSDGIVDDAARKLVFARPSTEYLAADPERDANPVHYACGWSVRRVGDGAHNEWHTGSLSGTATILVRRHDGLAWAVLFNTRNSAGGKHLGQLVDGAVHRAADEVTSWPQGRDLFPRFGLEAARRSAP